MQNYEVIFQWCIQAYLDTQTCEVLDKRDTVSEFVLKHS